MADILLKRDSSMAATSVPNTFIDKYMTHADGEFVKIYLYLLRCINSPDTPFSISGTADKFDYTEKDVKRALKYWEKMHLLRLGFNKKDELTEICMTDSAPGTVPAVSAQKTVSCDISDEPATESSSMAPPAEEPVSCAAPAAEPVKTAVPARETLNISFIPAGKPETAASHLPQFQSDENVKELLYVAERYLGHQLNHMETETILYWLDKLGFSPDLIDYLVEQCVAKDRASIQYMDKIALDWAKQGVRTLSEAKQTFADHNRTAYAVKKAFGISDRSLADHEYNYVQTWSGAMGFSDEIIALACQKTLCSTQKISFKYANSILESWQEQNVHTIAEIEKLDAIHKKEQTKKYTAAKASIQASIRNTKNVPVNSFTSFSQRTYDYDALERELLTR